MSGGLRFKVVIAVVAASLAGTIYAQDKEPTPVRQNPNIDRPITNENFDSAVVNVGILPVGENEIPDVTHVGATELSRQRLLVPLPANRNPHVDLVLPHDFR